MKARILATLLVICGLIGPEVCGAFCALSAARAQLASADVPMAGGDHAAPCHGAADSERAPASEPFGSSHSDSERMGCCDESVGIVSLALDGERQARVPQYATAFPAVASEPALPSGPSLDTGPGPGPSSPYRSVNPPLLN